MEHGTCSMELETQRARQKKKHHNVAIDGIESRGAEAGRATPRDRAAQEIWQNSCN